MLRYKSIMILSVIMHIKCNYTYKFIIKVTSIRLLLLFIMNHIEHLGESKLQVTEKLIRKMFFEVQTNG